MKFTPIIAIFLILTSCTSKQPEAEVRNSELIGKVFHFSNEFDDDDCGLVFRPQQCYNSTFIGFLDSTRFVHVSRCGGYDATYIGEYSFTDTLKLIYQKHVLNEYYYDESDSLITRIAEKKDDVRQRVRYFIPDTCGTVPFFIDAKVHEYGLSVHSATHPAIYGIEDSSAQINDVIKRMKVCGEWNDL